MENFSERQHKHEINLAELPENCISTILSFTTPRDICKLSAVSKLFRSAAYDDSLWNKFLPQQCYQILPRAVIPVAFASKRELYFRLCDSILIDEGTKIFWLKRSTVKIGYMLPARELFICWGEDERYWHWGYRNDSRFGEIAELLNVCWLEVGGAMDCRLLSADTEYRVVFVLRLTADSYGLDGQPIKFSVKTPGVEEIEFEHLLPHEVDEWVEVVAGEFTVRETEDIDDDSSHLEFRMKEVEAGHWKRGLLVYGVKIEPKST